MPYCLTHGLQQGKHCPECGALLSDSPPDSGDSIRVRSPEATAIVNFAPGTKERPRPAEVECPRCGHFNPLRNTFNCKGECSGKNLCRRHFDEEYEICIDCARTRRGEAKAEAERQAKLHADLATWRQRAEQAEAQVAELDRQGSETQETLEEAYIDLAAEQERTSSLARELDTVREQARQTAARVQALEAQIAQLQSERNQAQERVQALENDLTQHRQKLEQARLQITELERQLSETRAERDQAQAQVKTLQRERSQAHQRISVLEPDLAGWRGRAEKAESELAALARARQEAEAQKQAEAARRRAAEAKRQQEAEAQRQAEAEAARRRAAEAKRQQEAEAQRQAEAEAARRRAEEAKRRQPAIWQQIGIELVHIPAGEFLYGEDKRKVHLLEYGLARTPVTNAQYAAFVQAAGHRTPDHWQGRRVPSGKENHPVHVSWDDAVAFCQWAGLRLPTEQEWEKAARGSDGRKYPWGNQAPDKKLCNFAKNVGGTTPVSQYPAGASPYGLLDMAGNVWEWCEDWYDNEHKSRVLRGGSWDHDAQNVRAAVRNGITPVIRLVNLGFRPARSP